MVEFLYGVEVFINGLMAGVMYSLVALGFVLIFKASGIFNYAQGVMALFAAMTLVGVQEGQVPFAHLINAIFGTQYHHFGICTHTTDDRFQLKLGQTLRLINDDEGTVERAAAHKIQGLKLDIRAFFDVFDAAIGAFISPVQDLQIVIKCREPRRHFFLLRTR